MIFLASIAEETGRSVDTLRWVLRTYLPKIRKRGGIYLLNAREAGLLREELKKHRAVPGRGRRRGKNGSRRLP